ncbi:MAG: hypothetical protein C5B50_02640 [Verrucomicrobia bacterium]|nr:MAG: hypothetical protein C5B50_02640 [Verrucomicrobiota bacterium]
MGLRINLQHASWLAHILKPSGSVPPLKPDRDWEQTEVFNQFLEQFEHDFYSGIGYERLWREEVRRLAETVRSAGGPKGFSEGVRRIRHFLGDRPWTALLLPSGRDEELDERLCDPRLLREVCRIRPDDPGLILQLQEPPRDILVLNDLFPAFKTALASPNEWPGVLVWLNSGDSRFFTLKGIAGFHEELRWLFSHLAASRSIDLEELGILYGTAFASKSERVDEVTIIHLSDVHIGCKQASLRVPRLTQLVRNIIQEVGENRRFVIAISGDLMDSPEERNLNEVRVFLDSLANLVDEPLITCLGNHDVRKDGYLSEDLKMTMRIPSLGDSVREFCDGRLAIVSFNSVIKGKLARGFVGEQQMADIANQLDRNRRLQSARLIGMVHHHPIPVAVPKWYAQPFYEKWLGGAFEKTDALEDADGFVSFVETRGFGCIIHGHKHIPHIGKSIGGVPIYGCGSSVGKVDTVDKRPYMSVNLINYDLIKNQLSARLLAERVAGGGLVEDRRTEILSIPRQPKRIR